MQDFGEFLKPDIERDRAIEQGPSGVAFHCLLAPR
jgi:hypothetical protein